MNISTEKETAKVKNINISSFSSLFELIQIEVQCKEKYFKVFLARETGAFGNNIVKEPQKPHSKFKKICLLNIYREYLLCLQSNASGSFLQKCINSVYIIFSL